MNLQLSISYSSSSQMHFPASNFLPSSLPQLTHPLSIHSLQGTGLALVYIKMKKKDLCPLGACIYEVHNHWNLPWQSEHKLHHDIYASSVTDPCRESSLFQFSSLLNKNLQLIFKKFFGGGESGEKTKKKTCRLHVFI